MINIRMILEMLIAVNLLGPFAVSSLREEMARAAIDAHKNLYRVEAFHQLLVKGH